MFKKFKLPVGSIDKFQEKIKYKFINIDNLALALTHSSYANEMKGKDLESNERLEFLGDSILNAVISEHIFFKCPELSEGELTKIRANIVCETSLVKCSNDIGLGKYLLFGKGEELTGGRTRISILSDAFEALIGAIYIDSDIKSAQKFIIDKMEHTIADSINGILFMDYKTTLQEKIQQSGEQKITYQVISEKGPDHNKIFVVEVLALNKILGRGQGKSKKEAEQNAAKKALEINGDKL